MADPCTPSQLLVDAMENFGEDEPKEAVLVYITEGGNIVWKSTSVHRSLTIGMLEVCKACIMHDLVEGG